MSDTLLDRLRAAEPKRYEVGDAKYGPLGFTPEQIAQGLEALRKADGCGCAMSTVGKGWPLVPECDECWSVMLDAFMAGVQAPCKEGR